MARKAAEGARERILSVAAELFYAHGVRAVGMSQIIDGAGCGKNLLYRHFPSKGDLVAAYLEAEALHREQQAQEMLNAAGDDPADQIIALTRYLAECVADPRFRGCAMRNYVAEFPGDDGAATQVSLTYLRHARSRIDRLVHQTEAARPAELSEYIWLVHDGLYAMAARPWVRSNPEVAVQLVRDLLTSDLLTRGRRNASPRPVTKESRP
jgi:AcrR family transcriptional regulator